MEDKLSRREFFATGAATVVSFSVGSGCTFGLAGVRPQANDFEEEILIPEGDFLMGTSEEQVRRLAKSCGYHPAWFGGEMPQRSVHLPSFRIDKYPVTNRRYAAFCRSTGYRPPSLWKSGKVPEALLDHPVAGVSWADAAEYAHWVGKSLPTEAQWEKAARGTDGSVFSWGNSFNPKACVWNRSHLGNSQIDSVSAHPEGASPYGVMDMCGNLAEWCQDGPSDYVRFIRGGSWINDSWFFLRPACRSMSGAKQNDCSFYGFRCVREVS
jgi:formylglycine-generating enzyme required for sulfatase activity